MVMEAWSSALTRPGIGALFRDNHQCVHFGSGSKMHWVAKFFIPIATSYSKTERVNRSTYDGSELSNISRPGSHFLSVPLRQSPT